MERFCLFSSMFRLLPSLSSLPQTVRRLEEEIFCFKVKTLLQPINGVNFSVASASSNPLLLFPSLLLLSPSDNERSMMTVVKMKSMETEERKEEEREREESRLQIRLWKENTSIQRQLNVRFQTLERRDYGESK